jgi:drug/metabolite transporter (DMT)-like permease
MQMEKKAFSVTDLYLLLVMIFWGSDYLFAKIAMREISPDSFAAMRTLIATLIILPFFIKREKNWKVPMRHYFWFAGLAFIGTFGNRLTWSAGVNLTTASNAALLSATAPIYVLIISSIFLKSDVTFRAILGILISFVGVFLVIQKDWAGWEMSSKTFQGDLLMILSALLWAAFTVFANRILRQYSSIKVTAYVLLFGTIFFLPFLPNGKGVDWLEISPLAWFSVLYMSILSNCLAYFLWIKGIQNIGPLRAIIYQYLMPVIAILFAIPFLKETMTAMQITGAVIVFLGIFLARFE